MIAVLRRSTPNTRGSGLNTVVPLRLASWSHADSGCDGGGFCPIPQRGIGISFGSVIAVVSDPVSAAV
jgi:hypothetical protein